jgi:chromosome partitioning protein
MGKIEDPGALFAHYSGSAETFLVRVRDQVVAPNQAKVMRRWGIEQAAKLIGRSPQLIRAAEQDESGSLVKKLGPTPRDENGVRYYDLARINAYRDHFKTRYCRPPGSRAIRCAVANFKGGAAKTTTAVHLAQRCAIEGLRTLLIDLDAQASCTQAFGLVPALDVSMEQTITEVLIDNPSALRDTIVSTYIAGLDLVPTNLYLQEADLVLPNPGRNNQTQLGLHGGERLDVALQGVEDDYDVIVMDCGPNNGAVTINAMQAATGLLIPIPPAMNDFGSSAQFFKSMAEVFGHQSFRRKLDFVRVLVTNHSGTVEATQTEAMIRFSYGDLVLEPMMVHSVEIERATNDVGTVYEIQTPRGSAEAYKRSFLALERVNLAMIDVFKTTWEAQAKVGSAT